MNQRLFSRFEVLCENVKFVIVTLMRGTVKLNGSTVLLVKRNAFANSTVETSQ